MCLVKRFFVGICLATQVLLLGGCIQFQTSTQELMSPPVLTQEQKEIKNALSLAVGATDLKYKYPQNGDYRSSFIFYNIDSDEEDEALVFYQSDSKGSSIWVSILDRQPNIGWVSVWDTPAPEGSVSIDFVSFEKLVDTDSVNPVIGWTDATQNKTVIIYSYRDQQLMSLFERDYFQLAMTDLDNNSKTDIILLSPDNQYDDHFTQVFWAKQLDDGFAIVDAMRLEREISSFAAVTAGKLAPGQNALFLDENIDPYGSPLQVTDVISAKYIQEEKAFRLVNLLDSGEAYLSDLTLRPQEDLFCRDMDGDGMIEIPTIRALPGYDDEYYEGNKLYLTSYNKLKENKLVPKISGVLNRAHRYMITFPAKWIDKVTLISQPENGEWTFIKYQDSLSDTSVPLLRIRVYSTKDYHDKFENDYFSLIQKKGLFEYYAYIPPTNDALKITESELNGTTSQKGMFTFLE